MPPKRRASRSSKPDATTDVARQQFEAGQQLLAHYPIFSSLMWRTHLIRNDSGRCPKDGWAVVTQDGTIHVHPTRWGEPAEWFYVLAHCLLHLGMGHFRVRERQREWNAACDIVVARFLADLKLGQPLRDLRAVALPATTEERLYEHFCARGVPAELQHFGTGGEDGEDMLFTGERITADKAVDWQGWFGEALASAVTRAVDQAGGAESVAGERPQTRAQRARSWFISSFPLLGALAAAFEIVEDPLVCQRMGIAVAAVDPETREIFINPAAHLDEEESRFVMAHELLHVGLRHEVRRQGRDPYYWNVACDYVINGWLLEMRVGDLPQFGLLHDPALKGLSAEAVYDRIVTDLRRYRKLATLRGYGVGDILERRTPGWWAAPGGVELDDFYRRCLTQGLELHRGRGTLPGDMVEEIRALAQPPVPWDVELAKWFDDRFAPLEKVRSYARPSRRQSSTPDIPRPSYVPRPPDEDGRTFGVVLDTSGSMDRALLGKALGAIASYSMSREVPAARVVFCDAAAYDEGYMPPEDIAGRVRVRGRGGTVLQPGVDLLERAEDFPKEGPILIITDGLCDRVTVHRDHAFLVPQGARLPFVARGPVFRVR